MMEQDVERVLFSQEELRGRVAELGARIDRDYAGKEPMLISVLRGSFIFMADLVRHLDFPLTLDFMAASSYHGAQSSGKVNIQLVLHDDIAGRDVLLVEDILDTGNTLSKLVAELRSRNPASLKLCVLLDKPDRRTQPIQADYVGFTIPDAFVVGYGLDYEQQYRNLPYIGVLKPSVYQG